jgi:hypothetical protein
VTGHLQGGIDIGFGYAEGFLFEGIGNEFLEDLSRQCEVFFQDQFLGLFLSGCILRG